MFRFYYNSIAAVASALLLLATDATAISELGNGEILLDSKAAIEYDSNLFANSGEESDLIGSITAGIAFEQLERSVTNVVASAQVEVVRYLDLKEFDAENLFFDFEVSYPNNLEKNAYYKFGASWSQITRARSEVGQIVESENLGVFGTYQTYLNENSEVRLLGDLNTVSFKDPAFSDSEDLSFKVNYLYLYSSKLNFVTGYRYRDLSNEGGTGGVNSSLSSHTFDIGVEGKLRPKVEGNVSFGIQFVDFSESTDLARDAFFYYSIELEWRPNSKTWVSLIGSDDFQASPNGGVNNFRDISIRFNQILGHKASGSIGLTYAQEDFSGSRSRRDDSITLNSQYLRSLDQNKKLGLILDYEIRESDDAFFSYDRLRLALNFQVSF